MSSIQNQNDDRDRLLDPATETPLKGERQPDADDDPSTDASEPSLEDWIEAENSRPTLPDETADGLDDLEEEVRHQAEDLPLDTPGRLR